MKKKTLASVLSKTYDLPVRVIEYMIRKGIITEKGNTESDHEFLFKYRKMWLQADALRAQIREFPKPRREKLLEEAARPDRGPMQRHIFTRYVNAYRAGGVIPIVSKVAIDVRNIFGVDNYLAVQVVVKKMKKAAYDFVRAEKAKAAKEAKTDGLHHDF
ncbi:hypothetical protein [Geobacter sp.]|uniref:hypothetical protein n=1 Tax=Geobacter sp. TaxID=46610 RepID=UPI0027B891D1|nr:hypothetical protein [Geobacter sp.]